MNFVIGRSKDCKFVAILRKIGNSLMLQEDKYNSSKLGKVNVRLLLMLTNKLLCEKLTSLRFLSFESISKSNILKLFDERDR